MEKQFVKIFAILYCTVTFVVAGNAKSASRSEFEIPFDFIVKNQTYPAGKYSVERLTRSSPELLVLKQLGGAKGSSILLRRSTGDIKQRDQLQLSFSHADSKYVLLGIWVYGEKYASLSPDETPSNPPEAEPSPKKCLKSDYELTHLG